MSTSTPRPPDPLHRVRDRQRRAGLSRAWDCMRAVMKRRNPLADATNLSNAPHHHFTAEDVCSSSSSAAAASSSSAARVAVVGDEPSFASSASPSHHSARHSPSKRPTALPERFGELTPDSCADADSDDDAEEPMLPMVYTSNGINHQRAHEMFARYGLKYEPRFTRTADEPPSKIRRLQKPLNIHVRRTCHECETAIGPERICSGCGHRQCNKCPAQPAKGAADRAHEAAAEAVHNEVSPPPSLDMAPAPAPETAPETAPDNMPDTDAQTSTIESALRMTTLEEALSEPLEKDTGGTDSDDVEADVTSETLLQTLHNARSSRVRGGLDVVLKPKTQIIRRICHECNSQILPPNRTECQNCGHLRCTQCPRYPPKPEKWPHGSPGDEQASPSSESIAEPAVQRVYRKPRQRVRYICEHCRTTFVQRDHCDECGHGRCKDCIRVPPRRPPTTPVHGVSPSEEASVSSLALSAS